MQTTNPEPIPVNVAIWATALTYAGGLAIGFGAGILFSAWLLAGA